MENEDAGPDAPPPPPAADDAAATDMHTDETTASAEASAEATDEATDQGEAAGEAAGGAAGEGDGATGGVTFGEPETVEVDAERASATSVSWRESSLNRMTQVRGLFSLPAYHHRAANGTPTTLHSVNLSCPT